ncbi:twin-arginine translocase TatA/TatE family subunit [Paenibacillus hamazuiensis]|uniref:twin-arginine translocase TatA/TatE family subunit n=1 Tax=Paenibacillus hamazuiensis TaxID=2936508 RepID=UPI00200BC7A9|nr:twin-arginine translocase TatA/TatE family subunit [Paenibacillus hamazuiensis]
MGNLISPGHLVLVLLFILLLFGPSKLPELGRALGRTLKELKEGAREATAIVDLDAEQGLAQDPPAVYPPKKNE